MNIVFVAISKPHGLYAGIHDAIRAAAKRSECEVWCVSDTPVSCKNYFPISRYWESSHRFRVEASKANVPVYLQNSLCRWLVVREFVKREKIAPPILALDYDVLVFSNLQWAYRPFIGFDWCAPISNGTGTSAAYAVNNLGCLDAVEPLAYQLLKTPPLGHENKPLNDMILWTEMFLSGKWKVGDLRPEVDGCVFDANMHDDLTTYESEPSTNPMWGARTKRIVWGNYHPHFIRASDKQWVRAHWIHCWGSYKMRTAELLKHAGI